MVASSGERLVTDRARGGPSLDVLGAGLYLTEDRGKDRIECLESVHRGELAPSLADFDWVGLRRRLDHGPAQLGHVFHALPEAFRYEVRRYTAMTRAGWLVEQIVRSPGAPNGTTELLVDAAMRAAAVDQARYFTLGVAPLSARAGSADGTLWLRLALGWVRAHGRRFYNFGGLESFKAKFRPEGWEAAWLVTNDKTVRPRHLWAIASAYAGGSPMRTLARGLQRAARDERRRAWASVTASRA